MFPPPPPESHLSLAERLALLNPSDRTVALNALLNPTADPDSLQILDPDTALQELLADAGFWLRPTQLQAIQDTAWIVVLLGGRGSGKTRTASHWVIEKAQTPGTRIHLVARTAADVRDVIIRGESGILNVSPPGFQPEYFPTLRTADLAQRLSSPSLLAARSLTPSVGRRRTQPWRKSFPLGLRFSTLPVRRLGTTARSAPG